GFTLMFAIVVSFLSLALALLLAVKADNIIHGQGVYKVTLTWVYAVAPAIAGVIGAFLFNPHIGVFTELFSVVGWDFSFQTNPVDAT
ncbi:sugar ABC transporter permease, partial [Vibrio sp. 10N.261.49.A5]